MFPDNKNYTLGSGKLYFARFAPGTLAPDGPQVYFGNTPGFSLTTDTETLDHMDADNGIRTKDMSVMTSLDRTGTIDVDHISPNNLAMWFRGQADVATQAAGASLTYNLTNARKGGRYQIGRTTSNPVGDKAITVTSVTAGGSPLTVNVDYTVDGSTGGIIFLPGGSMPEPGEEGEDVVISYSRLAVEYNRVISGSQEIEGELFYRADNGTGQNFDYYFPRVKLSPSGDLALKGEDWMTASFDIEVLKLDDNTEHAYITGRAGSGL